MAKKESKYASLLNKILDNSTIEETDTVADSKFFNEKDMVTTAIPAINIALSGDFEGGLVPGLTMWAGPSKHFKTLFSLLMAKAYMDKYDDAVLLFYDSEFGTPKSYFGSVGIDMKRVVHSPLLDLEKLKFDIVKQLGQIERGEHVIIIIDSVGNIASKKEVEDALAEKSTADMTRAKQLKSLFRMVTPYLNMRDIPLVVVNHTYMEIGMYPKAIVSGGTGGIYSSDNIFIVGRQTEREGTEVTGYHFIINVEKSRYVREKSKIPISVSFNGGISKWSGLLDIALETGHVTNVKKGWYGKVDLDTGEVDKSSYRFSDTETSSFWEPILAQKSFKEAVRKKYQVSNGEILKAEVVEE